MAAANSRRNTPKNLQKPSISCLGLSAAKPPSWWRSDDGTATTAAPCGVGLWRRNPSGCLAVLSRLTSPLWRRPSRLWPPQPPQPHHGGVGLVVAADDLRDALSVIYLLFTHSRRSVSIRCQGYIGDFVLGCHAKDMVALCFGKLMCCEPAPPSPDYVPGLRSKKQAPPSPDYVPGPEHADDEIVAEDQARSEDGPPTSTSPKLCPQRDDGDDEDEPLEEDDDVNIEADEDKEEEEHPAPADSVVVALPTTDQAPSAEETESFETDESAATPPPQTPPYRVDSWVSIQSRPTPVWSDAEVARLLAISTPPSSPLSPWSSPLPRIPSPSLPLIPSPSLPLSTTLTCVISSTTSLPYSFIWLSSCMDTARAADYGFVATMDREIRRDPEREVGYGITDSSEVEIRELHACLIAKRRQAVTSEMLKADHRRSTEMRELRTADRDHTQGRCDTAAIKDMLPPLQDIRDLAGGKIMPPRKAPRTRTTPATTTNTTSVTNAQIYAMIDQGVTTALAARDANRNGDDSYTSGTSTEGVVELTQWFERMETVFRISHYSVENQIKFSTCTLLAGTDVIGYNQRFQELALPCVRMFPEESDKVERYVGGLPDMIHRSVVASKPKTMHEATKMATELMDKKISTLAECQAENKRKLDNNNLPIDKMWLELTPLGLVKGRRHYRSDCPELKNQNHGNQAEGTEARGMVYALGGGETDQDLNNIEDEIEA
ncbi:hypothetical protein Tco_0842369 [Tanacetum coccineum]|uniref:Reverse transcriptase domain-containing protein n=1 Tax=Tanacetum coccineum TaxID=301880 RepID=A0ABQ5B183_9ASTR